MTRPAETLTIPAANLPWPTPRYVTGTELVTNGTFDTDTDWTTTANTSISGGVLNFSGASYGESVSQDIGYTAGTPVAVTVDVTVTSGIIDIWLGGTATFDYQIIRATSSGSYTAYRVSSGTDGVLYVRSLQAGTTATIDNISVKEINPLALSIQMSGEMTYADTAIGTEVKFWDWRSDANNLLLSYLYASGATTGQYVLEQRLNGTADYAGGDATAYAAGVNVPFNTASRHTSLAVQEAADGITTAEETATIIGLPDLENTDLKLANFFMGTIDTFRMWADDLGDTGIAEASSLSLLPSLNLTFDGQSTSFTDTGMVV